MSGGRVRSGVRTKPISGSSTSANMIRLATIAKAVTALKSCTSVNDS